MAMPDRESKMASMRRIDLMTSGGDCAGLYAALRPVFHCAVFGHDWEVIWIEDGALGSLQQLIGVRSLSHDDFERRLIRQSSAVLGSTDAGNSFPFKSSDGSEQDLSDEAIQAMREYSVEGLVGVSGIVGGADVILIPEISCDIAHVARRLKTAKEHGHRFALLIVAESVKSSEGGEVIARNAPGNELCGGIGLTLAARLSKIVTADTRVTVLGHVQRGGIPMARYRMIASAFGIRAVDQLAEVARDRMVTWRSRAVIDVPIADAISAYQWVEPSGPAVAAELGIGISFCDR